MCSSKKLLGGEGWVVRKRREAGRMQLAQRVEVRRAGQGRGGAPEARTVRCQWRSP